MSSNSVGGGQIAITPYSVAHPITSDPLRNFRYIVSFGPVEDQNASWATGIHGGKSLMGFTSVSGLSKSTEAIPYREGGMNTNVHQVPGQTTFSPITLQRGVKLGNTQQWDWISQLHKVVNSRATSPSDGVSQGYGFRANIDIFLLHMPIPGATLENYDHVKGEQVDAFWRIYNAWPTSIAFSDLNAGDNALLVEQVTLVHEGFYHTVADTKGNIVIP